MGIFKRLYRLFLSILSILTMFFTPCLPLVSADAVTTVIVSSPDAWAHGSTNKVVMNKTGVLHTVYNMFDTQLTHHAWSDDEGATWTNQTLGNYTEYPTIVIDSNDNLHVVALNITGADHPVYWRFYADNQTWGHYQILASPANDYMRPELVINSTDCMTLGFYSSVGLWVYGMNYWPTNDSWGGIYQILTGQLTTTGQQPFSFFFDYNDTLHTVANSIVGGSNTIHYRNRTASGWNTDVYLTGLGGGRLYDNPDILVDFDDTIHIVYVNESGPAVDTVEYITHDTNSWIAPTELINDSKLETPSISLDGRGLYYVTYVESDFDIRVISCNNGTWSANQTIYSGANNIHVPGLMCQMFPASGYQRLNIPAVSYMYMFSSFDGVTNYRYYAGVEANISWNWGVSISVYDDSTGNALNNFNLTFINDTTTYSATGCTTPAFFNFTDIPLGDDVFILVNQTQYEDQYFYEDFAVGVGNTYINAYLTPINVSNLYALYVLDTTDEPIKDVLFTIDKYISDAVGFDTVATRYSDSNGEVLIYLNAGDIYHVYLSKTGYQSTDSIYIPSASVYTKYFVLLSEETEYENVTSFEEIITYEGYANLSNNRIYINYSDAWLETINTGITLYCYNRSTGVTSVITTDSRSGDNSFSINSAVNTSNQHWAVLHLNHTSLGHTTATIYFEVNRTTLTNETWFNALLSANLGGNPFGWSNTFGIFLLLAGLFMFGPQNSGLSLMITGFMLLFVNSIIGIYILGVTVPIVFIILGVFSLWVTHRKVG